MSPKKPPNSIEKYLNHYPQSVIKQAQQLFNQRRLGDYLLARYPCKHDVVNDHQLREYVVGLKNQHMKKSAPLAQVTYDNTLHVIHNALGVHTYKTQVQGKKAKTKHTIRIGGVFRKTPEPFLRMIAVHELAHLKEKGHNKAFYRLCEHMEPNYHQYEFDMRLYLVQLEAEGSLY